MDQQPSLYYTSHLLSWEKTDFIRDCTEQSTEPSDTQHLQHASAPHPLCDGIRISHTIFSHLKHSLTQVYSKPQCSLISSVLWAPGFADLQRSVSPVFSDVQDFLSPSVLYMTLFCFSQQYWECSPGATPLLQLVVVQPITLCSSHPIYHLFW